MMNKEIYLVLEFMIFVMFMVKLRSHCLYKVKKMLDFILNLTIDDYGYIVVLQFLVPCILLHQPSGRTFVWYSVSVHLLLLYFHLFFYVKVRLMR